MGMIVEIEINCGSSNAMIKIVLTIIGCLGGGMKELKKSEMNFRKG